MYYQNVRRWSELESAALLVPIVIGQSVTSVLSGQYISRRKRYGEVLWFGYTLWTLAAGLRCAFFGRHTSPVVIVFILLIEGAGIGCTFQPSESVLGSRDELRLDTTSSNLSLHRYTCVYSTH